MDGTLALYAIAAGRAASGWTAVHLSPGRTLTLALLVGCGWLLAAAGDTSATLLGQSAVLCAAVVGIGAYALRAPGQAQDQRRAPIAQWFDELAADSQASANPIWVYAMEADKRHFVSPSGKGGVAYRLCAGVALAAGEPIGPAEDRLALAAEFKTYCERRGLVPALYQTLAEEIDAYRTVGLRALKIGEEAMIDLPSFTLVGKKIANVRHCVTHVERAGTHAELYLDGVRDEHILDGLDAVSAAWLGARSGRGEMGFSMGSYSREAMHSTCVVLARDAHGAVCAFVTFRHVPGRGMVLDLMRRTTAAPSGVVDFLIARALEGFRDADLRFASLSLAPMAGVCGDGRAPLMERLLGLLYEHGDAVYRYRSLFNFKRKFTPQWQSRYLVYPAGPWRLLRVLLAMTLVHLPRGTMRPPNPRAAARALFGLVRQSLDWRHGLQPAALAWNLRLMWVLTLAFSLPEGRAAVGMLARHMLPHAYAAFALVLVAVNVCGALALSRRLAIGRLLLAAGAAGFFVKAVWGLGTGYDGGLLSWAVSLTFAPVEVWMIWFLLQPEVRTHLVRARALLRGRVYTSAV
jgi:lysylphosphatidylglycerol synthetase-like protein (DUF2156 family)